MSNYDEIYQNVGDQGKIVGNAITLEANAKISSPLKAQF